MIAYEDVYPDQGCPKCGEDDCDCVILHPIYCDCSECREGRAALQEHEAE